MPSRAPSSSAIPGHASAAHTAARSSRTHGFSLIEVLIGTAVMLIVFTAIAAALTAMTRFAERDRLYADAILLANDQIEMIHALPYDSIGTVAGLPAGSIPQTDTIVQDGHTFTRRTFIQYVDDPADGLDAADTLTADYKRVKVEISFDSRGTTASFALVTTIAPKSQESLVGAGVLRINVTDANNGPILGASVHVLNTTVATSVDILTSTNASGTISFPGAWAGGGYEVTVTKPGYSSAQTYRASSTNPNPSPSPLTVAENSTTEIYFKIDHLSTINLATAALPVWHELAEPFADVSGLATSSNIQVTGGALILSGSPGTYAASGAATSQPTSASALGQWLMFETTRTLPAGTDVRFRFEYETASGTFATVPDADLPGNSAGFSANAVDLGALATSTYATLRVVALLTTTNPALTPSVDRWAFSYNEPAAAVPNVSITFVGSKTIGTDTLGSPVYKYDASHTTNASGALTLANMEFDTYSVTLSGHTIAEACPALPIVLDPGTTLTETLTLASTGGNAYALQVAHALGGPVPRAEVRLTGPTNVARATGPCGVAYFAGIPGGTYTVSVIAPGLTSTTTTRTISGVTTDSITLTP